jgi:uncharacterized protein (DUF302 family)
MSMYHIVETSKPVADAIRDLEAAVGAHGFGVLHVYDLKDTLARKGFPIARACHIFEVCNPKQAQRVLALDMRLNMALPCRISVFEDGGKTKIGTILPTALLGALSSDGALADVAAGVESTLRAIIAAAASEPRATER